MIWARHAQREQERCPNAVAVPDLTMTIPTAKTLAAITRRLTPRSSRRRVRSPRTIPIGHHLAKRPDARRAMLPLSPLILPVALRLATARTTPSSQMTIRSTRRRGNSSLTRPKYSRPTSMLLDQTSNVNRPRRAAQGARPQQVQVRGQRAAAPRKRVLAAGAQRAAPAPDRQACASAFLQSVSAYRRPSPARR
jgi:hypothetical protein